MNNLDFEESFNKLIEPLTNNSYNIDGKSIKEIFNLRVRDLNISQNQINNILGIERKSLNSILNNTAKRVDLINILKLADFLNLNPGEFIKVYVKELPLNSITELEKTKRTNYLASNFDLQSLKKAKFIENTRNIKEIEERITKFFGLNNIFNYSENVYFSAFSRTKNPSNNLMRDFWIKSACLQFERINNPNQYNREALIDLIKKIKPYTMNVEKGLLIVAKALYNIGVTVIYQPHLPKTQVRGATLFINNKPCIVITNLYNKYATLWFTLLHELHHVLYDIEGIAQRTYHMSIHEEHDLFLINEDEANDFARDFLFSKEDINYIKPFIDNRHIVEQYAKEKQIHPSIIYTFYMFDLTENGTNNGWKKFFHKYLPDSKLALKEFNLNPWEKESIDEIVTELKNTVFNI